MTYASWGAFVVVVLQPYPLWTGSVIPDVRPNQPSAHVRVPQFWWDMADTINADTRPGKVLVLPLDDYYQMPTTWGFAGVDSIPNLLFQRPTVQPKPDGYFGEVPGFGADVRAVETALLERRPHRRAAAARGDGHLARRRAARPRPRACPAGRSPTTASSMPRSRRPRA